MILPRRGLALPSQRPAVAAVLARIRTDRARAEARERIILAAWDGIDAPKDQPA